ncbi:MAG: EAL domain-containing protein [Clostridiales bacterium]|nr:EAL domain-containing protein [Clostridiales bacterium]
MKVRKKILIVEDNKLNRDLLRVILESDYEILEAENGLEALKILDVYKNRLSLILLDIVMPVMDGYTFLGIIREKEEYSALPVIVVTQSDDDTDEVTALSRGATDFVMKPYNAQVIRHRLESIIRLKETASMMNLFHYDRLTGIYSKEYFYQCAKELLADNPDKEYDVICSDFENFKLVNDSYGVKAGDRLLRKTAELLLRTVQGRGLCARLDSDQFVCMIEHKEASYSDELFHRITEMVNRQTVAKNVSIKWGVYVTRDRTTEIEQMCAWALESARSIKGRYGKYVAYYDDEMRSRILHEQEITACMEQALAEGQFHVWLQPKYRLDGSPLADAEALVRWYHPEWGMQSPGVFIPLFEKNGFITKLDLFVWEEACRMIRDFDEENLGPINISVNVSRADIYNLDLLATLTGLVKKYGIAPERLHVEITESVITENMELIVRTVKKLRKNGFVIEMDDFGSGYSSLNMLNRMPMDILKLDMQFIRSEMDKPAREGILRYIIGLAHWLQLDVVAEGVETKSQMERLKNLDCDYIQGFYMAKPMEPEALEELLKKEKESAGKKHRIPLRRKGDKGQDRVLLLIDEDDTDCRKICDIFRDSYQLEQASDENDVSTKLATYGDRIDVILLTLSLAKQNRNMLWNLVLREKKVWNTPVILLGEPDAVSEEEALLMGADDFESLLCREGSLMIRVQKAAERKHRILSDPEKKDSGAPSA